MHVRNLLIGLASVTLGVAYVGAVGDGPLVFPGAALAAAGAVAAWRAVRRKNTRAAQLIGGAMLASVGLMCIASSHGNAQPTLLGTAFALVGTFSAVQALNVASGA